MGYYIRASSFTSHVVSRCMISSKHNMKKKQHLYFEMGFISKISQAACITIRGWLDDGCIHMHLQEHYTNCYCHSFYCWKCSPITSQPTHVLLETANRCDCSISTKCNGATILAFIWDNWGAQTDTNCGAEVRYMNLMGCIL